MVVRSFSIGPQKSRTLSFSSCPVGEAQVFFLCAAVAAEPIDAATHEVAHCSGAVISAIHWNPATIVTPTISMCALDLSKARTAFTLRSRTTDLLGARHKSPDASFA